MTGAGFIANFTDYDNDGDLDIYLVNDEFINPIGNKLWRNDGAGRNLARCFTQCRKGSGRGLQSLRHGPRRGRLRQRRRHGLLLLQCRPHGAVAEPAATAPSRTSPRSAGVSFPMGIGWGAVFLDYDNDGWRDIYLSIADTAEHKDVGANKLFRNNADGTFTPVARHNEATDVRMSIGVAYADYDHDGWVDLVVGNLDEGYRLYKNQQGQTSGQPLARHRTRRRGTRCNRDAAGARVYVTAGGVAQMQEVILGSESVTAENDLVQYFGPSGGERSAEARIRWSNGERNRSSKTSARTCSVTRSSTVKQHYRLCRRKSCRKNRQALLPGVSRHAETLEPAAVFTGSQCETCPPDGSGGRRTADQSPTAFA
ncbi:MAG: CRTAC1 family protein [Candidatus Moduliflexus flocculans]|nr:CRTAC1 family protein [Candidatus Moduliflexus flocculans]